MLAILDDLVVSSPQVERHWLRDVWFVLMSLIISVAFPQTLLLCDAPVAAVGPGTPYRGSKWGAVGWWN